MTADEELASVAERAATCVAEQLRTAFRSRPELDFKRDRHDPVTAHDRAAEAAIREVILDAVPDSRIVGEEGGAVGQGRVHWYVDPIDGTANFASGLAFFCTSVAAVVDGTVVAGAIYDPVRRDLFTAGPSGAFHNGTPLRSAGAAKETEALLVSSYPNPREVRADGDLALARLGRFITEFRTTRRPGSAALSLAHVAAGWVDVALGLSVSTWDLAAGSLLVRQAGGRFLGLRPAGSPATPSWQGPGYLATVGTLDPTGGVILDALADSHEVTW
ncbi:inositol monophosphatase family protein [Micromonospora polyrhachis]|uniref:inositol-phosphate phosphatase n=1 Tax=Micromonospora polyrhachis TaxID=1282883 RepID=A0A7W7SWB9_9ACTN|nr:inositol monophosphatase [Micromonospora polyrhachis]MBB4962185.1 myo-inositol-1(or 4)-monophosphatase [Micromonospora polyrhachis]